MKQDTKAQASALATILVIDDEELIRQYLCEILTLLGYRVLAAQDGQMALGIYQRQFREIDFVLTDMVMPGMFGTELLDCMRILNPALKAAIMSGYYERADLTAESLAKVVGMLRKPFSADALRDLLDKALHSGPSASHSLVAEAEACEEWLLAEGACSPKPYDLRR